MPEIQPSGSNPLTKYFRQPKIYISLPSRGHYYPAGAIEMPENGELPIFPMTAKDEMMIKTPDAMLSGQSTVEVIQSCVPAIKNAWGIPSVDLDTILIAIRIATYGEKMDVGIKTPVTGEEKTYEVDLRIMLDQFQQLEFVDTFQVDQMKVKIRPLTYKEFTETSMRTFEEQRIFRTLNDETVPEEQKLSAFSASFKKLTQLTVDTVEKSIVSVEVEDQIVDNPQFIKEFIANADKTVFKSVTDHVDEQKKKFTTKPLVVDATPEELEKGVPETYEVPVTFDQANFFV